MPIRLQLILVLTVIAVVPLLALGIGNLVRSEHVLISRTVQHLESVAELQRERIRTLIGRHRERLELVASRTQLRRSLHEFLRTGDPAAQERMNRILADALGSVPAFERITVSDLNGRVVAGTRSSDLGTSISTEPYFGAARNGGFTLAVERSGSDGIDIVLAGPLKLEQPIGVVVIQSDSRDLDALLSNYHVLASTGETLLAGPHGQGGALFLAGLRFAGDTGLERAVPAAAVREPMGRALAGEERALLDAVDYRGESVFAVTRHLPEMGWGLVAKIDRAEVLDTIAGARLWTGGVLAATLSLALLAVVRLGRMIREPIGQLLSAAEAVERGDLTRRVSVNGPSELATLARAFNAMLQSMQQSNARLTEEIGHRRHYEERFRQVIESAPTAMLLCGGAGEIILVNAATERLFGYSRQELIGAPVEMLLPPRYRASHPSQRDAYFDRPSTRAMGAGRDLFGQHKDGNEVPIEIGLNPIETDDGCLVLSAIVDLTERRRIESDLKARNHRLAEQDWLKSGQFELAEHMRGELGVEELTANVLQFLCRYLEAPLGAFYLRDRDSGLRLSAGFALPAEGVPTSVAIGEGILGQAALDKRLVLLEPVPAGHLPLASGLGVSACGAALIVPLVRAGQLKGVIELGTLQGFPPIQQELLTLVAESVAIALDVAQTSQRMQELLEESQRKSEEVERASRYKSEFLANMSHELRTPLNSLLLLAQNLAENRAQTLLPQELKSVQIIERSGRQLLYLINDILDMSKIEAGKLLLIEEGVGIADLLEELLEQFEALAETKAIALRMRVDPQVPALLQTDGQRLGQILKNLVSNAIKFTDEGSVEVRVGPAAHAETSMIAFEVVDTGPGIPAEQQAGIFGAFQQGDGGISRSHGGTGLGLAISRKLAELLGGEIRLDSGPGAGSRFTLLLPRREGSLPDGAPVEMPMSLLPEPAATSIDDETSDADRSLAGRRVLLVEDDMRSAFALSGSLSAQGIAVEIAHDGEVALEYLENHRAYDLVLMDLMMPRMDGLEAIRRLRGQPKGYRDVPVIALTAKAMREDREQCLDAGATDFVAKPVELERLLCAMRRALADPAEAA